MVLHYKQKNKKNLKLIITKYKLRNTFNLIHKYIEIKKQIKLVWYIDRYLNK
jgi:hypothetical protein